MRQIIATGLLAGIGFTMSLFISNLAFYDPDEVAMLQLAKTGILIGSILSGIVGFLILRSATRPPDSS